MASPHEQPSVLDNISLVTEPVSTLLQTGLNLVTGHGAVLPGHHYIGPGNPIPHGRAVDSDDRIAEEHDQAYLQAHTAGDIQRADRRAIAQFTADWNRNSNIHSLVGAQGLRIKAGIESITGVIYPRIGSYI